MSEGWKPKAHGSLRVTAISMPPFQAYEPWYSVLELDRIGPMIQMKQHGPYLMILNISSRTFHHKLYLYTYVCIIKHHIIHVCYQGLYNFETNIWRYISTYYYLKLDYTRMKSPATNRFQAVHPCYEPTPKPHPQFLQERIPVCKFTVLGTGSAAWYSSSVI